MNHADFEAELQRRLQDPAQVHRLKSLVEAAYKPCPSDYRLPGLPDTDDIRLLQVTMFDNSKTVKSEKESLFGLSLTYWNTDIPDDGFKLSKLNSNKVNVALYDSDQFAYRLRKMRVKSCPTAWVKEMKAVLDVSGADWLYGPVLTRNGYLPNQFIMMDAATDLPGRTIIATGLADPIVLENWSRRQCNGTPLAEKAIFQSRYASVEFGNGKWATDRHSKLHSDAAEADYASTQVTDE